MYADIYIDIVCKAYYGIKVGIQYEDGETMDTKERKRELLEQMSKLRNSLCENQITREDAVEQLRTLTSDFQSLYEDGPPSPYDLPSLLAEMIEEDNVSLEKVGDFIGVLIRAYSRLN